MLEAYVYPAEGGAAEYPGFIKGSNSKASIEFPSDPQYRYTFWIGLDYEVFLVSRMRENYTHTGDARLSVRSGITQSGPVVTAAGLIMIAVFASFIFAANAIIKSRDLPLLSEYLLMHSL